MDLYIEQQFEENYRVDANFRWLQNLKKENEELCLTVCGVERCLPDKYFGPTVRNDYHVHTILHGKGYLEVNGRHYELKKGQIFVTPPGVTVYYYADSEHPWHYCWISFSGSKAKDYLERAGFTVNHPYRDCNAKPEKFLEFSERILNHHELTVQNDLLRSSILYEFMAFLIETAGTQAKQKTKLDYSPDIYIHSALDYMHHDFATIQVNEVADQIGLSRFYFTKLFKEKMNMSPKEYLVNYRLKEAAKLLRSSSYSVSQIAEKVGYSSPFSFSDSFKKVYGASPRDYRNEHIKD